MVAIIKFHHTSLEQLFYINCISAIDHTNVSSLFVGLGHMCADA